MQRQLALDLSRAGDRAVLAVRGEIDLETSPQLWSGIQEHMPGSGPGGLWVDLSDVDYIDSSGIAVLVQGHKHASRSRKVFGLQSPSRTVRNLIELAQLHKLFRIDDGPDGDGT